MMTRYKHTEFNDDDNSSVGAIQMNETNAASTYHLRFHSSRASLRWRSRNRLEKGLIITTLGMGGIILVLLVVIAAKSASTTRILHVQPHTKLQPSTTTALEVVPQPCPTERTYPTPPKFDVSRVYAKKYSKMDVSYAAMPNQFPPTEPSPPCLEKHCIFAASEILKSLDTSVDPCHDFYAFACNQWIKDNPLPDGKSVWGTFGKLEMRNQMLIRNVLERPLSYFKSSAERKAKLYYESCMDDGEIMDKLGASPLREFIESIGGWNVTTPHFHPERWDMSMTMKRMQNRYNMGGFFSWVVGEDDKNSTNHVIQIDQSGLALPTRDHYLNITAHEKVLAAYLEYMVRVGMLLGAREHEARRQMKDVLDLETKIAEITIPMDERRNEEAMYHSMTLGDLDKMAPFMNFTEHFQDAFRPLNRQITKKEKVVVYAPEFLSNLTKIVATYKSTTKGKVTLANYLVWHGIRTLTSCLSKPFRDAYKGVRKALLGSDGSEETWRYCVTDTNNVVGFAIGAIFVRQTFQGKAKPQAERMIDDIREAFKLNLESLTWMDPLTKRLAIEKADAITDMIGFPDFILNSTLLDARYEGLEIDSHEYFQNNIRINQYNLLKNLEKLDAPVNKTAWGMTPSTVNAYYTPTKNQIVFPAGILQKPFYDVNYPKSLNYGAMGVVMGHELTHAFDDQGREYDRYGNLKKWWGPLSVTRFMEKTSCIIKQYGKFEVVGMNLNGKQTVGENIADNGGLKAAFHAFSRSKPEKEADHLPLPGLNLTHSQLFFVSFAQVWCSAVTNEAATLQIEKDPHSPPEYRVIGPLSNLREFAKEFNCPLGSRMNPKDKCEIW